MKIKDLNSIYVFNRVKNAFETNEHIVIGIHMRDSISLDKSTLPDNIYDALDRIDGINTLATVVEKLSRVDREVFIELIETLFEYKVVELKQPKVLETMYDRQINYFKLVTGDLKEANNIQSKITNSRVSIVGLGGCGSYIFYTLSAMGIGYIRAYDYDHVALSNLSCQILYNHNDIGKLKIEVAKEKAKLINPNIEYKFVNKKIDTLKDAIMCFDGVDLVFLAADEPRPELIYTFSEAAKQTGKPLLNVGSSGSNAVIGPIFIPTTTACYRCVYGLHSQSESKFVKRIKNNYQTSLIDPFNAIAGSAASLEGVKYLTGYEKSILEGKGMILDMETYDKVICDNMSHQNCDICN